MKQATCKQTLHLMHFVLALPGHAAHQSCLGTSVTKWSVLSYLASAGTRTIRAAGLPVEPVFLALAYCMKYVLAMRLWNSRRSSCSTRAADEFLYRSQAFGTHTHLESTQTKATTTFLYGCWFDRLLHSDQVYLPLPCSCISVWDLADWSLLVITRRH